MESIAPAADASHLPSQSEVCLRTARVAHELRNHLNGISGAAQLMRVSTVTPCSPTREDMLDVIETSCRRMLVAVGDLIDAACSADSTLSIHLSPTELMDVLDDCMKIVRATARRKSIQLRLIVDESLRQRRWMLDSARLEQVLLNLLSNAVRFTDQGSVELSVRDGGEAGARSSIRFDVTDTGSGMPERDLRALKASLATAAAFAPSTLVRRGGSGLGLPTCARILRAWGSVMDLSCGVAGGVTVGFGLEVSPAA